MEIEALLLRAKPEFDNGHTIFWPHGGPQAAERKTFRAMFQSFLNRGYTIFAPNFRGSTGYGSEFVKLDRKSTRLNSSHVAISYAVFCLKKKRHPVVTPSI